MANQRLRFGVFLLVAWTLILAGGLIMGNIAPLAIVTDVLGYIVAAGLTIQGWMEGKSRTYRPVSVSGQVGRPPKSN